MGELIINIIIGLAGLYFLWQQNQIFRQQNQIFAAQAAGGSQTPSEISTKNRLKRYWPMIAMAILMLLAWAATGYDYYERHYGFGYDPLRAWDDAKPLERIYTHTFTNETVVLDNKHFIAPNTFDNVTFVYNGSGPFMIDLPTQFITHDGKMMSRIASRNKVVTQTMVAETMMMEASGCRIGFSNLGPDGQMEGAPAK